MFLMKPPGLLHVYIIVYCVFARQTFGGNGYSGQDEQEVRLGQQPGKGQEIFPETFSISFQHGDDIAYFDLSRDDVITQTLSPVLFKLSSYLPDDLMTDKNTEHFAFYHNRNTQDANMTLHFVVYRTDPSSLATFFGQIISDENIFNVQPKQWGTDSYKIIQDFDTETQHKRQSAANHGQANIIELLVWIAPDLYEFHSSRLSATSYNVDDWLQSFSKSLTRDVDLIFKTISTGPVRVYLQGAGFDKKTELASWFTNNANDKDLDANTALQEMTSHLINKVRAGLLPRYDHALVLTRKFLRDNGHLKIAHGKMNSVCNSGDGSSISMASVGSSSFLSAIVRSIGIGFGVEDDDDFQMAKGTENFKGMDINQDTYKMQFSSFGQIKLARHLLKLKQNCLQTENGGTRFNDFLQSLRFGDQPKEKQCEIIFGPESSQCSKCHHGNCFDKQNAESEKSLSMKEVAGSEDTATMTMTMSTMPPMTSDLSTRSTYVPPTSFEPVSMTTFSPVSDGTTTPTRVTDGSSPPTNQPPRPTPSTPDPRSDNNGTTLPSSSDIPSTSIDPQSSSIMTEIMTSIPSSPVTTTPTPVTDNTDPPIDIINGTTTPISTTVCTTTSDGRTLCTTTSTTTTDNTATPTRMTNGTSPPTNQPPRPTPSTPDPRSDNNGTTLPSSSDIPSTSIDPQSSSIMTEIMTSIPSSPVTTTPTPVTDNTATPTRMTNGTSPPTMQPPRPPLSTPGTTADGDATTIPSTRYVPPSSSLSTDRMTSDPSSPVTMTTPIISSIATSTVEISPEEQRACECCAQCRCKEACNACSSSRIPPTTPPPGPVKCRGRGGCCRRKSIRGYDDIGTDTFYTDKNDT